MRYFILSLILCISIFGYAEEFYGSENVTTDSTFYQLAKTIDLRNVERMALIINNYGDGDCDASYELRVYPDRTTGETLYEGVATSAGATLVDTSASFTTNVIGQQIYNVVDKSQGTITDTTGTSIFAVLSGGTDNAWEVGDYYKVDTPQKHYALYSASLAAGEQSVLELENYYTRIDLFIKKTAAGDSTSTLNYSYNLKIRK